MRRRLSEKMGLFGNRERETDNDEEEQEPKRECAFETLWENNEDGKWDCCLRDDICEKEICPFWQNKK